LREECEQGICENCLLEDKVKEFYPEVCGPVEHDIIRFARKILSEAFVKKIDEEIINAE